MNRVFLRLAIIAAVAALAGCNGNSNSTAKPAPMGGTVLADVNGDKLTSVELDSLSPQGFEITQDNLPKILDKWVSNTLMYQEAVKRGILKETQVQAHLKRLERDYLVNALLDRMTSSIKVGQDALMQYFNQHKDEFTYEVKMMRIVMPDSTAAAATLAELKAGADFQKLAKERSQDMLLEAGQESRYFSRGVGDPRQGGDPALEEAIFALQPGQVSEVVPSQEGYQIIKLVDKKKTKAEVSFAEARDYIEAILSYRKSQAMVDSVLKSLRESAKIELKPDAYFAPAAK